MKKFNAIRVALLITFMLFSVNIVFAEIGIKQIDINSIQPLIKNTDVSFNVQLFNDLNETGTATLKATSTGIILYEETINFEESTDFNENVLWQNMTLNTNKGLHSVLFELTSISLSDTNSSNNSFTKTVEFFDGKNIVLSNIQVSTTSPTPNQEISMTTSIQNNGDIEISNSFQTCFYYDNALQSCQNTASLGIQETKTLSFTFTTPNDFAGTHEIKFFADKDNEITEINEEDNNGLIQLTTIPLPDLFIDSSDISISSAIAGEPITFQATIRNIGSLIANNALIKVYHTSSQPEYLLHSETIPSLASNSQQTITFVYTPAIEGYDIIIIKLDPENQIEEGNENNNYAEKAFTVSTEDTNEISPTSYTLFFEISSECIALISNSDRLISKGIIEDGNGFSFSFELIDGLGKTIVSTQAKDGWQTVLPGRTIKVLSVTKFTANLLMIYQKQNSVLYTTCTKNVSDAITEAESFKENFRNCQTTLNETETKYNIELTTKTSLQSQVNNLNEAVSLCNNEKSTLSTNLSLKEDSCQEKISLMMANQDSQCKSLLQLEKDKTEAETIRANKAEDERNLWMILFFLPFGIVGIILLYLSQRRK